MMKIIKGTFTIFTHEDITDIEVYKALCAAKEDLQKKYCNMLMGAYIDERTDDGDGEV